MIKQEVFGSQSDFPQTIPIRRYLILSSPRTGSSMLSSALHQTNLAGVPLEYFNERVLDHLGSPLAYEKLFGHFNEITARRTSPNGIFGMKIHFHQFANLFLTEDGIAPAGDLFLRQFSHFILIDRSDKISQAISYVIALDKEKWASTNPEEANTSAITLTDGKVVRILNEMSFLMRETNAWRRLIKQRGLNCIDVRYEDLASDFESTFARVLAFLELPAVAAAPKTVKQGGGKTLEAKRQFLARIGADLV